VAKSFAPETPAAAALPLSGLPFRKAGSSPSGEPTP
jgi:hypothetical protein